MGEGLRITVQLGAFQRADLFQYLALGSRVTQGQVEFVQQAAEQGAIEQAQGGAWLLAPQPFGGAGDILWKAFRRELQAEHDFGGCGCNALRQPQTPGEQAQPLAVAPDQQGDHAEQRSPEQHLDHLRHGLEDPPVLQGFHERAQSTFISVIPARLRGTLVAQAPAGHGFAVSERRSGEDLFRCAVRPLAAELLLLQPRGFRAVRVLRWQRAALRVAGGGPGGLGRQQHQAASDQQQHGIGAADQALAQAAEHQFDVPGFQLRAAVQVEGEAAGHVDRLPDHQHQCIEQVGQVIQPQPVALGGADQRLPFPVRQPLLRQQQVEQRHQAEPEGELQVHADQRQPGCATGIALAENGEPLPACFSVQAFELLHRQGEAARRAEAAP
ncbi:hypothetical protein D3C76_681040 [compost metagenome]